MNSYIIVKVLALCLGAVSVVVSRTLPEQQSEISARAAGRYGFSNNPTNQDSADAKIDPSGFNAATDVNDLKRRLEGMADVDRKVLSKRDRDFRGRDCHTICVALDPEVFYPEPNQDDCKSIPSLLDPHSNQTFSIGSSKVVHNLRFGQCEVAFFNTAGTTSIYDFDLLAQVSQMLNSDNTTCHGPVKQCNFNSENGVVLAHTVYIGQLIHDVESG